jgi:hypothetical protein
MPSTGDGIEKCRHDAVQEGTGANGEKRRRRGVLAACCKTAIAMDAVGLSRKMQRLAIWLVMAISPSIQSDRVRLRRATTTASIYAGAKPAWMKAASRAGSNRSPDMV